MTGIQNSGLDLNRGYRVESSREPQIESFDVSVLCFKVSLQYDDGIVWKKLVIQQKTDTSFKIIQVQKSDIHGNIHGNPESVNELITENTHRLAIRSYFANKGIVADFTKLIKDAQVTHTQPTVKADIPPYMNLVYMCDNEKVELYLQYKQGNTFSVVNLAGSSKSVQDKEIHVKDDVLYGNAAETFLKNLGYTLIQEVQDTIITDIESNKIIGPR